MDWSIRTRNTAPAHRHLLEPAAPGDTLSIADHPPNCNSGPLFLGDHLRQYRQAVLDFTRAIRLNGADTDLYYGRGYTYHLQKKYKKALADYDRAIRLNPKYAASFYAKGLIYEEMKRWKEARTAYRTYIEIAPTEEKEYIHDAKVSSRRLRGK